MSTLLAGSRPKTESYLAVFFALSEPLRARIVQMMAKQDSGELPCTALDDELPVGKSTISYHVGILRRAGLITVRKAGRNYFYRLNQLVFDDFAPEFLEHLREQEMLDLDTILLTR